MCGYVSKIQLPENTLIDRGMLDLSSSPLFPTAQRGDWYTISVEGNLGGLGSDLELRRGDVIYCLTDSPEGSAMLVGNNWNILQSKIDQAELDRLLDEDSGFPITPNP